MYTFCIVLILIASVLIILAVLVQSPKSGMAANFGAANQTVGVRQTADFLEKFTWTMAAAILAMSLVATMAMDREKLATSNSSKAAAVGDALMEHIAAPEAEGVVPALDITTVEETVVEE